MNKPKAIRLGLLMALTVVATVAAFAPSAFASITSHASTVYGSTVPGSHGDYTIEQGFTYDGNGPEPTGGTGDLKKWIADSPAGLAGNPNAIPWADRCPPASFDPSNVMSSYVMGSCPASAQVGEAQVYLVNDVQSGGNCPTNVGNPGYPLDCLAAGFDMKDLGGPMLGKIYLLQTSPEVPTTLGTHLSSKSYQDLPNPPFPAPGCVAAPTCPLQPKTKSVIAPVTNQSAANNGDTDFRLRTVPADYSTPPAALLPTALGHNSWMVPPPAGPGTQLHIRQINQHLYGFAANGAPFLTMPTRCSNWDSIAYAIPQSGADGNLAMDPNNPGDDKYVQSNVDSVTPDCATLPAPGAAMGAVLTSTARDANPGLTVTVADPAPIGHDQVKKTVITLPASVSVDVDALDSVCSVAARDADNCPAASKIGTASIATPLISAGLTGRVYMTASPTRALPYMSIFVDGAIKFRLDATTRFVGPQFNQIETTLDNLPQVPFTNFTVNIAGGASNSLLYSRTCPTDGSSPGDGPTTFSLVGYTGQSNTGVSNNAFDGCYGVKTPPKYRHCMRVGRVWKRTANGLVDRTNIAKVQLQTGHRSKHTHSRATIKKSPYAFRLTLRKAHFKTNKKYYYNYRITYKPTVDAPSGKIFKSKLGTFRTCGKR